MKSLVGGFALVLGMVGSVACNMGQQQQQTVVTVTPKPASVAAGSLTMTFTAAIQHDHKSGLGVTWSLQGGGTLSNQQPLSVDYTPPSSVPSSPSVTITATAQVDSSASDSATFTVSPGTGISGTNYVGAQSPGDIWLFTLDHLGHQFAATNQTTGANYSGNISGIAGIPNPINGFIKLQVNNSTDPLIVSGTTGYAIEDPGVAVLLVLGDAAIAKPIVLLAPGNCPSLSGPTIVDLVNLGKSSYNSTQSESYAVVNATQSGNNYNFLLNSYLLDGTLRSQSGQLPSGSCSNGVITIPNVPFNGTPATVTAATATNGLYVIDLGPGNGAAVGSQSIVTQTDTFILGNYLGVLFRRNDPALISSLVGFGPGSGFTISGGIFQNIDTDAFQAHGTDVSITFSNSTNAQGFLTGIVKDSYGTHSPFVAMLSVNNGKYYLFGITTDLSNTQPYVFILAPAVP